MAKEIKKEKSCGGIIYLQDHDKIKFLIIQQNLGHFGFPKGHVEVGETELATAIREIKEETGLDVILNNEWRMITSYCPKPNIYKEVVYFIGQPLNTSFLIQESEVKQALWCEFNEALKLLTHENSKSLLCQAWDYIKKINKNSL